MNLLRYVSRVNPVSDTLRHLDRLVPPPVHRLGVLRHQAAGYAVEPVPHRGGREPPQLGKLPTV